MLHRSRQFSLDEQLLRRNVERFRGGLVFKAHGLLYHSTLGLRVIKKKRSSETTDCEDRLVCTAGEESLVLLFFITLTPRVE